MLESSMWVVETGSTWICFGTSAAPVASRGWIQTPDLQAERGTVVLMRDGTVEVAELEESSYDLVLLIQTIEHVADPRALLRRVRDLLRPGGRLLIVTDNTGSLDFAIFKRRHWGGYHFRATGTCSTAFPFVSSLRRAGWTSSTTTMVSPVNWVYSVRNVLDDWGASRRPSQPVHPRVPLLAVFTAFDGCHNLAGRRALLQP